jgi:hypothetical protein
MHNANPGKYSHELTQALQQALFQATDASAAAHVVRQIARFLESHGLEPANVAIHVTQPTQH